MLTGKKKTYGIGADKWINNESPNPESPSTTPLPLSKCDPSYPTLCIPLNSPDLDCGEISQRNFPVVGSDPHGFDRDNDGIGCGS